MNDITPAQLAAILTEKLRDADYDNPAPASPSDLPYAQFWQSVMNAMPKLKIEELAGICIMQDQWHGQQVTEETL